MKRPIYMFQSHSGHMVIHLDRSILGSRDQQLRAPMGDVKPLNYVAHMKGKQTNDGPIIGALSCFPCIIRLLRAIMHISLLVMFDDCCSAITRSTIAAIHKV